MSSLDPTYSNGPASAQLTVKANKIIISTAFALFAMFFGAGNIVFPLYLGANVGQHIAITLAGFLVAAVGVPLMGLVAISLYKGDYYAFFARLGKIPALLIITVLMIVLGPMGAMPRTETTTFNTLLPYLPEFLQNNAIFSLFYCGLVFFLAYRDTKVMDILGFFLSPIKIVAFSCLVFVGLLFTSHPGNVVTYTAVEALQKAISLGYNTMDLLAAIFFGTMAFKAINIATTENPNLNATKITLKACVLASVIISLVYAGFMLMAHNHAGILNGLGAEKTISVIANNVLGKFGGLFVCITVSFACIATTLALGQAMTLCFQQDICKGYISKRISLVIIMFLTYLMSNLGFQGILKFSLPVINIIYPSLIVLCVCNILYKWKGIKTLGIPVCITLAVTLGFSILS